ncbi:hypothetical protein [Acaryochloris sp. IP29b_bin.148]|uniref:hypothetical protein n=1 Tax=Acaryochloris sp. IP29b_bin.148 TaxID=2969218 RepID=UPI00262FBF80|nr:hypothetical protein [Acaryochloris sp. IP29b_bin.148]
MSSSTTSSSNQPSILLKPECLEVLISLAILPLLLALLGQQQLLRGFLTLGGWCEGLLQGMALPFLEIAE